MIESMHGTEEKALKINLDAVRFGTFAEIGAGQEVVRWFFHVGKASSTVARSISAYDMAIGNGLYGPAEHYVSRARLQAMLDREFSELIEQLDATRGERNAFFVFADTVATDGSSRASGGHGWLGIRFQSRPKAQPSEIIVHIEMLDAFAASQQETVGLVGVNLIHGAFNLYGDTGALIRNLMDGLDRRRVEIDTIKFSGPLFTDVDNRLMSLQLVEQGLTDTAMLTAAGEVVQASEILHNRPVVVERGSFRPVTNVTLNMLDAASRQLQRNYDTAAGDTVAIMEMTMNNLMAGRTIDNQDFLARAAVLGALDKMVMISSYTRFDLVTTYLRQYTQNWIGMAAGVPTLRAIFDEKYYEKLEGGVLEGLGRLFNGRVKLFVYPTATASSGQLETADNIAIDPKLQYLYKHLLDSGLIEAVQQFDIDQLHVSPGEVLKRLQAGDTTWVNFVPGPAAALIQRNGLFGLAATQGESPPRKY